MRVPIQPPPGLNSDSTAFEAPGSWNTGSKVRFYHGQPQSIGGETSLQSASAETYSSARKLFAYKVSNTAYLAVARNIITGESIQIVNTTTWARTNIGPNIAADKLNYSFAMFGDVLLFSPKDQTLYESVGGAAAAAVAGAPAQITTMVVTPSRQVMALGCNEEVSATFNGRCIRWSDIGVRTTWATASNNNAGEYILPGQENIVTGCILGDYIVIWTVGSMWLGQYIGQPGQTFVFTRIGSTGIVAPDAWAILRGTVYWMSPDSNFYVYNVGDLPQEISCPISLEVHEANVGPNSTYNAVANRRFGEIWFSLGTDTTSISYVYCVDESQNAQRPVWFKAGGFAAAVDDPLLAGALNMGDSTCIYINSSGATNFALKAFDKQFNAVIPAWEIESSGFYLDEAKRRVQIQKIINDENGNYGSYTVGVTVKDYPDSSTSVLENYTVANAGEGRTDMRTSGRMAQVKFSHTGRTAGDVWRMGKPVFEVQPLGNR